MMIIRSIVRVLLLIGMLSSTSFVSLGQEIESITLKISSSSPMEGTSYNVSIFHGMSDIKLKVEASTMDQMVIKSTIVREMSLTEEQFKAIVTSIMNIKQSDVVGGPHPNFLHSVSCSISVGKRGTYVSYHVASPYHLTDERKLNDFLTSYELILKTANLEPIK